MDMGMGDSALANLPLSDPRCINSSCIAFDAATNRSQEITPWAGQFEYGHWTTWYYIVILFVLMMIHGLRTLNDRSAPPTTKVPTTSTLLQKAVAAGRYLAYRRIRGPLADRFGLPSFGMLAFLLATVLFVSILTFAARPYYRAHEGYGSPPIAIRTGLMAFACTPILVALAGKANPVTLLTGISHEKLNVVHRWVGWITFVLSVVHTVPFIVAPLRDRGYTSLHQQFYGYGKIGVTMYSGVPPLAILFGLVTLSLPYVRHRVYEGFYYSHILLAITYLGLLFWHAGDTLDSWAYLWATVALWLASYLARVFWYTRPLNIHSQWFTGAPTTLTRLPGAMTRIEVLPPPGFTHTPAQHCFLRFPSVSLTDNHPFTISTTAPLQDLTTVGRDAADRNPTEKPQSLVFLARTYAGFTRKLAAYSASQPDILASAWIDGPYGGTSRPIQRLYDTLILVAGGAGITACLPWLQYDVHRSNPEPRDGFRVKRVVLVWVLRQEQHFSWVGDALESARAAAVESDVAVEMRFYVTNRAASTAVVSDALGMSAVDNEIELLDNPQSPSRPSPRTDRMTRLGECVSGRPRMKSLIPEVVGQEKTMVIGCGPESLRDDLANACARLQARVLRGEAQEVAMHLEAFGW